MRKVIVAILALISSTAMAEPAGNWTGFYVGANAGWLSADMKDGYFTNSPPGVDPFSPGRSDQAAAGFYGGYQFQSGNWVLGAESGFDAALNEGYAARNIDATHCNVGSGTYTCEGRINNLFRAGARLGWTFERWLAYGTGGYARGLVQTRVFESATSHNNVATGYSDGWYLGGGIEFAVLNNLSFGVEYRHYDFGTFRLGNDVTSNRRQLSATADAVMARLTIKLGP